MGEDTTISPGDGKPDELSKYVEEVSEAVAIAAEEKNFEGAVDLLKKSERLLEALTAEGMQLDPDSSYLDGCIYTRKQRKMGSPRLSSTQRLQRWRYECRTRLQLCAILSQMNKHESAFFHSQEAGKIADKAILETYKLCRESLLVNKKGRKSAQISEIYNNTGSPGFESAVKVFPTLKDLVERQGTKVFANRLPAKKLDLRSVLGVHHFDHWIYSFNIGDLMVVPVLSLGDLRREGSVVDELASDAVLEKICLLAVSYFSIAAESRFLSRRNQSPRAREGELWHKKALSISQDFLPCECPLNGHIKQSYTRNYPPEAEKRLHSSSPHPRKSISKPMLKTFDFTTHRVIGFRSPKGGTAEEIVEQILGKSNEPVKTVKRKSVVRARAGSVRRRCRSSKREESGIKVVEMPVTTIPTEESEGFAEMSRSLHLSQEESKALSPLGRRVSTGIRKVNVSILTFNEEDDDEEARLPTKENEQSSGGEQSQRNREAEEEIVLTSSVLYGENIGAKEEQAGCKAENLAKLGKKGRL